MIPSEKLCGPSGPQDVCHPIDPHKQEDRAHDGGGKVDTVVISVGAGDAVPRGIALEVFKLDGLAGHAAVTQLPSLDGGAVGHLELVAQLALVASAPAVRGAGA